MRKNVISLLLSASLVCTMLPVQGVAREAAAAGRVTKVEKSAKKAADDTDKVTGGGSFGGQEDPETGQTTPDTHKWTYQAGSGLLTISGTGAMPAYTDKTYEDAPWYRYRSGIKKVVFTGEVTSIGDYAFYRDYPELTTVDISGAANLTSVGTKALAGDSNSPNQIKEIIGIEQLVELDQGAFTYSQISGAISLPKVTTLSCANVFSETQVTSVSMKNLTEISNGAFSSCRTLESVEMPKLTTISSNAFSNCESLKAIDFPKLTTISGNETFYKCISVTEVSLPELTTIDSNYANGRTFDMLSSLEELRLPKLRTVGGYAFSNCASLVKVELPELTEMGTNCFKADRCLVSISMPKLTRIYPQTFDECLSLVYFDILEGALQTSLSSSSTTPLFRYCDSLQRIYTHEVPTSNVSVAVMSNETNVYHDSTVYVPSDEAKTKWSAYASQAGDGKVVVVEDYDTLPKESTLIIKAKNYDAGSPVDPEIVENTSGGSVTWKYYEQYSDSSNSSIKRMRLLDAKPTAPGTYYVQGSTEAVDGQYFATTSNFSQFTIYGEIGDESGKWAYNNKNNALIIKDASVVAADYEQKTQPWKTYDRVFTKVELADGVSALTEIGDYAFYDCQNVTEFPVSSELTRVGKNAFYWCTAWNRSEPLSIRAIGASAFYNCRALASDITLESGMTSVPANAFNNCILVKKIAVPDTVTEFGASCFTGCAKLEEINIPAGVTALPDGFFSGTGVSEVKIPDQVTSIGESAFKGLHISSLTLPSHLESLGASAFENCDRLERVELPASLTTLQAATFAWASGLKQIVIPDTVTKIEGSTNKSMGLFYGAKNLELVIFENTEYTEETLGKSGKAADYASTTNYNNKDKKNYVVDQMFQNTNDKVQVICDGSTYEVLESYMKSPYIDGNVESGKYYSGWNGQRTSDGWTSPDCLNGVSVISGLLQADIEETTALKAEDYDSTLWDALQAEVTKAKALPEITLDYESVSAYLNAKDDIRKGVRAFLLDTYQKCADILQSDYFDWDISTDEALDAWYDYEDAYDVAKDVLRETSLLTVAEYAEYEAKLNKAKKGLIPVPADEVRAEVDTLKAEVDAMNAAEYTPESWAAVQEALTEVNALPDDALISVVQAAQKKLQDAVAALVKVSGGDGNGDGSGTGNGDGTNPSQKPDDGSGTGTNPTQKPDDGSGTGTNPSQKPDDGSGTGTNPTQKPDDSNGTGTNPTKAPDGSGGNVTSPTKAPDGSGSGNNGNKVTVKKVTLKKATSKKKKTAVIQWKKLSGVTGYQVQLATDKKFKKNKKTKTVKKAKTTKVTIKKLKRKKKYFVRVRAYKTVSKKKYYGKWSGVKKVKIK